MGFRLVPKSVTLNDLNGVMAIILRYFQGLKCAGTRRYAPVLRTGTSEKSLRQYRHFCQKNSLQQCRIS